MKEMLKEPEVVGLIVLAAVILAAVVASWII